MASAKLRRKNGVVFVLDALGASSYSEDKIKKFLSARKRLNSILSHQAQTISTRTKIKEPNTYTFGDTLIVVIPLTSQKLLNKHLLVSLMLMQNYLFHSLEEGILFRGAFSVGSYIEDPESNTVMGEAVTDAAAWYEKSEWLGLACTPKTNNFIEYHLPASYFDPLFMAYYPVPMKSKDSIDLYTVSWAGRFFHSDDTTKEPRKRFLEILKTQPIPYGTEKKIANSKKYFEFIEQEILAKKHNQPNT